MNMIKNKALVNKNKNEIYDYQFRIQNKKKCFTIPLLRMNKMLNYLSGMTKKFVI